ncbi:helix-turn-helix transcriptional regulator [Brevundimonas mediterranea]|jgi:excisionase family DNA binding protein
MFEVETNHAEAVVPILLNTKQVARILGVSHRTLEDWRRKGGGPKFVMFGRMVRYRRSDIAAYLSRPTFQNTGEAALAA